MKFGNIQIVLRLTLDRKFAFFVQCPVAQNNRAYVVVVAQRLSENLNPLVFLLLVCVIFRSDNVVYFHFHIYWGRVSKWS